MTLKSTIIPKKVRVFYAAYASLPTTGLVEEDLGYATDRLVLYRWSGAAWVAITIHVSSGAAASIPTAANLPNGSIYHETDTDNVKMVEAGAWVLISSADIDALTVLGFQTIPAVQVGTVTTPENANENNVNNAAWIDALTEGVEITLPSFLKIKEFRHYGHGDNNGDGSYKIQYQDSNGQWHDWVTGIATRGTSWTAFDDSGGSAKAIAIRFIATAIDTGGSGNVLGELEVRG